MSLFLLIFAVNLSSYADYRVFQLKITNTNSSKERLVSSTLDHLQYPTYHPLQVAEKVELITSWMCYSDRSGPKDFCPPPSSNGFTPPSVENPRAPSSQ